MNKIFSLLVLLLTIGCSTVEDEINPENQTPVDVYIAGQKNNQACYWKNNQEVLLVNGENTRADTLLVANNVVHVLGKKYLDNWFGEYFYWKDNVQTNLTETFGLSGQLLIRITGIEVVGNDVYFVGYTKNPIITAEIYELAYWKNGIKTVLAIVNNPTYQAQIKVVGNDVYVIGNTANCFTICNGVYKNGVFTPVNSLDVRLIDFAVKNNEVYVYGNNLLTGTGYYKNTATNAETSIAQNIRKIVFESNAMYILTYNAILKEGTAIQTNAAPSNGITNYISFIQDFKVLNENVYYITSGAPLNGIPFTLVGINNTTVFESLDNSSNFTGITIVQN